LRPEFLGDSYDIVKRFFCETLRSLGYTVYIDPLFTGDWSGQERTFYQFLGAEPYTGVKPRPQATALFLDPDTGVNEKGGSSHVSYDRLIKEAKKHSIVFVFDQAFSRAGKAESKLQAKLNKVAQFGCAALYYTSHAQFLFVSREQQYLDQLRNELLARGLPTTRLIAPNPTIERDARKSGARHSS
jgi:hypothetical protein